MWTLGGIQIVVTEYNRDVNQTVPRLQPLAGGTILQYFGYESPIVKLSCLVVSEEEEELLESLTTSGIAFELISPMGSKGNFAVQKVSAVLTNTIAQTIRPDLDCDELVYKVEIILFKEED